MCIRYQINEKSIPRCPAQSRMHIPARASEVRGHDVTGEAQCSPPYSIVVEIGMVGDHL